MATKKKKASKKVVKDNSFQVIGERTPFMTFKVTEQTIYWGVLFVYIFALSLWVLNIQLDILRILESISSTL